MSSKKAKLKNPEGIADSSGYSPRLSMPGARDVVEVKEESWLSIAFGWSKGIIAFLVIAAIVLIGLYSALSATLMVYTPLASDSSERSWVIRNAWQETGNRPPVGEQIVISTTTLVPSDFWKWIIIGWTGIEDPAVVKVITTDYDKIYVKNSKFTLESNKKETLKGFVSSPAFKYDQKVEPEATLQLNRQYLVQCVSGSCKPGTYFVINSGQIFGKERK